MSYTPLNVIKGAKIKINGVSVRAQECVCGIMDIDYEAGRTADGTMHRNKVATKRKYSVTMPPCRTKVIQPLLAAMQTSNGTDAHFQCTFPDPQAESGQYTGTFYVGDRSVPIYNYDLDIWNHLTFDIVEI